mmetsp:Transcript_74472/g.125418  ORF Transcript_74472/g.125418 Transcript_74472/m.125418 type:complete len:213 (-) Transcript_74472:160-798(-)
MTIWIPAVIECVWLRCPFKPPRTPRQSVVRTQEIIKATHGVSFGMYASRGTAPNVTKEANIITPCFVGPLASPSSGRMPNSSTIIRSRYTSGYFMRVSITRVASSRETPLLTYKSTISFFSPSGWDSSSQRSRSRSALAKSISARLLVYSPKPIAKPSAKRLAKPNIKTDAVSILSEAPTAADTIAKVVRIPSSPPNTILFTNVLPKPACPS